MISIQTYCFCVSSNGMCCLGLPHTTTVNGMVKFITTAVLRKLFLLYLWDLTKLYSLIFDHHAMCRAVPRDMVLSSNFLFKERDFHIVCYVAFCLSKAPPHFTLHSMRTHVQFKQSNGMDILADLTLCDYGDVIMSAMPSQITSFTIVCLTVYSGTDQRKDQSSASLAFVRGIHWWSVNSPHKGPITRKMFPFDDVIMAAIDLTGSPP